MSMERFFCSNIGTRYLSLLFGRYLVKNGHMQVGKHHFRMLAFQFKQSRNIISGSENTNEIVFLTNIYSVYCHKLVIFPLNFDKD